MSTSSRVSADEESDHGPEASDSYESISPRADEPDSTGWLLERTGSDLGGSVSGISDLPAPSQRMSRRMDMEIRQSKRKANKHELAKAVASALASRTVTQHQRNIRAISRQINTYQAYMALLAVISILIGVAINEVCSGADYVQEPEPPLDGEAADIFPRVCRSGCVCAAFSDLLTQSLMTTARLCIHCARWHMKFSSSFGCLQL